ncbi:MAG: hypothetical protein ACOH16_14370 [Propionibacteriaceae bacterium]
MTHGESTEHADTTGKIKESWGKDNSDEGIEVEGQLQQVEARSANTDKEGSGSVVSGTSDDIDPERQTPG